MELKEIAEKIYNHFDGREKILISSGEEIYNMNRETATEIMVELNLIDKFLYHGGIENEEECEKFKKRYANLIERIS